MQGVRIYEYGGIEKLVYETAELPEPKAGEVRVKVAATGVNFIETYQRRGWYRVALPFTPGGEFAGEVDKLGEGVSDIQVGERVATAAGTGGYAQYALAPAGKLVKLPDEMTFEQGAAVLLQGMTAHYLAFSTFPLKAGDTALVHAAAGGVGQLLVQLAKLRGARVIGTVSSEEKAAVARSAGADEVILYTQADFETETRRLTGGKGVDVVYDSVGQATFQKSLNCLSPRGMMVLYGQSSGAVEPFDPQSLAQKGSLFVTRPILGHYTQTREELLSRSGDLFNWLKGGQLKVNIDRTYPLQAAADAHRYLEARSTKGKVVLIP